MILIVLEKKKREREKKYTVVMMHTLHVFICLFLSLSVCYTAATVFDDVLRIGKKWCKNTRTREKRKKNCADLYRKRTSTS
jgi:hypothetical protein